MKILIAGELNPDLILRNYQTFPQPGKEILVEDLLLTLGSSSAICAVGLARLGNAVTLAANVGADTYGDFCTGLLQRENIDISLIRRRDDLKTGITISITSAADRALVTYPGAIRSLRAQELPPDVFASFQHFHVSSYYLQDALRPGLRELFAEARRQGLSTSLDTGYDPSEQWSGQLLETLREVNIFLPNELEVQGITRCHDAADGLKALENGHTLTVVKLGRRGSIALDHGKLVSVEAFSIDAIDTTGAGDSFDAGFLHCWLRGKPLRECMLFGAACGALSTRGLGGIATQPSEAEAENYLYLAAAGGTF
jgi:sugar/nucleoside kinase (ribokinase family)